jgi:hypothetical protein
VGSEVTPGVRGVAGGWIVDLSPDLNALALREIFQVADHLIGVTPTLAVNYG